MVQNDPQMIKNTTEKNKIIDEAKKKLKRTAKIILKKIKKRLKRTVKK